MQRNSAASSAPTKRSMSIKNGPLRFVVVCIAKNRRHRTALSATVDANARILRANADDNGLDLPKLRKDLLGLIDQKCPAVDVVELMVRCTSEFNVALARGLHRFEITQQDLSDLEVCHQQTAKLVSELRRSENSGPLVFFPDLLPEGVRQAR